MIFSCPRSFVVTCNTILGSWQDIPRKTFLTSGNKTVKRFCQRVSMKVCFGVCPWRAVLWHKQTNQLPLALPTTLVIAARPLQVMFLHHHPCHRLAFSYCMIANCLHLERRNYSQDVKGAKAPSTWATGGSKKSGGSVSPLPWEWPHHPHPWSSQEPAVGCHILMSWSCLGLLCSSSLSYFLFLLSSLPLDGGGSCPWDEMEPLQQQGGSSDRHTVWGFSLLLP